MKTFKMGGVHPEENKISTNAVIEQMPLPKQVAVLMNQHLGAPATPIVAKGDKVKVGQLIAEAQAFMCANIHSPVSGTVNKIDVCKDMVGLPKTAIYIDVEGDEWMETIDRTPDIKRECNLEPKEIVAKLKEMGIVGLGGATFPAHIKYSVPEGKKAEYLIINAAECEPYLTSDHRVMMEHAEEICIGISLLRKALGVPNAYIGIESNKPEPIRVMTETAKKFEGIIVEPLVVKYPQGAEKQLINSITGRKVPSGKLPIATKLNLIGTIPGSDELVIVTLNGSMKNEYRGGRTEVHIYIAKELDTAYGFVDPKRKFTHIGDVGYAPKKPKAPRTGRIKRTRSKKTQSEQNNR